MGLVQGPIFNMERPRLLRKPNVPEAAEEFGRLASRLAQSELPEYAGLTQLARARCLETLGSRTAETDALIAAARQFMLAHQEQSDQHAATSGAQLQAAIALYNAAIRHQLSAQRGLLAARTCLELAHALRRQGRTRQALLYYQDAADLQTPPAALESRELAVRCQLELVDLEAALSSLDDMHTALEELGGSSSAHSLTARYLRWCEVTQVLLLLAAEPPAGQPKPAHTRLLDGLTKPDGRHRGGHLSECVHLLLQSLVLAVRRRHLSALYRLEGDLRPHLDESQRHLLDRLVRQVETRVPAQK
ncbi:Factor VIII intron 22 protein [Amphibalanus amphitrite]|uniref:Factor VIII intron 22 protein n=1 Tax=Amphibalanus amphitrite TaxID=1232801 RepID=A0A6A4VBM2_AMPAM|nr:Factor VIII intron 22 protein [Amphibalanus amphitrite]KAF0291073.1 Factor VIII intron 22 protein [Amphibalanus amphitrite]